MGSVHTQSLLIVLKTLLKQVCVYARTDPSSDPAVLQRVCDGVLGVKLPDSIDALKKKLEEIEGVASSLPDGTTVLKTAESQLDQAHRLLQNAQNARYTIT